MLMLCCSVGTEWMKDKFRIWIWGRTESSGRTCATIIKKEVTQLVVLTSKSMDTKVCIS